MSELVNAFATATQMLAALRARRVSAVELLDLHRGRIARHNPALNAIVEPDFDRARRDAEAADARRVRGAGRGTDAPGVRQRHRRLDPRARRLLRSLWSSPERDGDAAQRPVPAAADAQRRRGDGRAGAAGALGR